MLQQFRSCSDQSVEGSPDALLMQAALQPVVAPHGSRSQTPTVANHVSESLRHVTPRGTVRRPSIGHDLLSEQLQRLLLNCKHSRGRVGGSEGDSPLRSVAQASPALHEDDGSTVARTVTTDTAEVAAEAGTLGQEDRLQRWSEALDDGFPSKVTAFLFWSRGSKPWRVFLAASTMS